MLYTEYLQDVGTYTPGKGKLILGVVSAIVRRMRGRKIREDGSLIRLGRDSQLANKPRTVCRRSVFYLNHA